MWHERGTSLLALRGTWITELFDGCEDRLQLAVRGYPRGVVGSAKGASNMYTPRIDRNTHPSNGLCSVNDPGSAFLTCNQRKVPDTNYQESWTRFAVH